MNKTCNSSKNLIAFVVKDPHLTVSNGAVACPSSSVKCGFLFAKNNLNGHEY